MDVSQKRAMQAIGELSIRCARDGHSLTLVVQFPAGRLVRTGRRYYRVPGPGSGRGVASACVKPMAHLIASRYIF